MSSLNSVPQEVLEHIAFFVATNNFLGPPSDLVPLILSSRRIHERLSIASNPHLYARVFAHKFDLRPALRRFGEESLSPFTISLELKRRCTHLKRLRTRTDAYGTKGGGGSHDVLHSLLLRSFIWLLENEEKNERQLRDYANIDCWLHEFWFNYDGASNATYLMQDNKWPSNDPNTTLAMWLYWLLLKPSKPQFIDNSLNHSKVCRLIYLQYNITKLSWMEFIPSANPGSPSRITHFDREVDLTPLPIAIPAILSFLTLANKPSSSGPLSHPSSSLKVTVHVKPSSEWDSEWARCRMLSRAEHDNILTEAFSPGSVEGVWEGQFTYTEFTAYAALLGGAPPHVLQKSVVARHQQTWKLREYHLMASDISSYDSGIDLDIDSNTEPLPAGDPLRSYFPSGTHIKEDREGLTVIAPHRSGSIRYQRTSRIASHTFKRREVKKVADVIIMGEGHSSWGQFNLIGRVRPCDGLVSLSKEYHIDSKSVACLALMFSQNVLLSEVRDRSSVYRNFALKDFGKNIDTQQGKLDHLNVRMETTSPLGWTKAGVSPGRVRLPRYAPRIMITLDVMAFPSEQRHYQENYGIQSPYIDSFKLSGVSSQRKLCDTTYQSPSSKLRDETGNGMFVVPNATKGLGILVKSVQGNEDKSLRGIGRAIQNLAQVQTQANNVKGNIMD
ncbi:hypothetical protein AN958_01712 [Leucoagaricus sp. SymC.cos]|nr:hypothetical protein AN958_01712 [Leucoagaricus sp. SymC.cos]